MVQIINGVLVNILKFWKLTYSFSSVSKTDFDDYINCWIYKKEYEEGWEKAKDHNYITGKYGGSAHQKRNLNLRLTEKIPVVFHNLQN